MVDVTVGVLDGVNVAVCVLVGKGVFVGRGVRVLVGNGVLLARNVGNNTATEVFPTIGPSVGVRG